MSSPALVLEDPSRDLWQQVATDVQKFAQERELSDRWPVLGCWKRAIALGASVEGPPAEEHLLRGAELKERVERTELVQRLAAADLARAASTVAPHQYVLLLADAAGVVVLASGGGGFSERARRVRLIPGASWSESARGTNAIGTAIAERRPVFVHGSAHLARSYHELVCYAAPIFDADGSLVAVLDATSDLPCAAGGVGVAVSRTADAITRALRDRAYGQAGASVRAALTRALDRMEGIALLVEASGLVTRMNAGARVLFGASSALGDVLGVSLDALVMEGVGGSGLTLARGGRSYRARVEPIEGPTGHAIAWLVFVEPGAAPRTKAAVVPARAAKGDLAFASVFSRDLELDRALSLARRMAPSALPVLLLAETGSGKELVARAIHDASPRADGPFVAVNCGAIAPSLLESELFGYGQGAFTGAERGGRSGLFASASGGTLFLDEVAEMAPAMQAALLRVLEDGTYRRVGESGAQRADVRVLSATCQDLPAMVAAGTFRRDLYYRLKGAEVSLPPLRQRRDRAALAAHLLVVVARKRGIVPAPQLSPEVIGLFERYGWPGNVRELHTLLEVALVLAAGSPTIELAHLPDDFVSGAEAVHSSAPSAPLLPAHGALSEVAPLASLEASAVRRTLAEVDGNITLAAKRLGVARSTLYRMMRRHRL